MPVRDTLHSPQGLPRCALLLPWLDVHMCDDHRSVLTSSRTAMQRLSCLKPPGFDVKWTTRVKLLRSSAVMIKMMSYETGNL